MGIVVVSCRQEADLDIQNDNINISEKIIENDAEGQQTSSRPDSTHVGVDPNDPPKTGTHWKVGDTISISTDPNDPPKTGTHWKVVK